VAEELSRATLEKLIDLDTHNCPYGRVTTVLADCALLKGMHKNANTTTLEASATAHSILPRLPESIPSPISEYELDEGMASGRECPNVESEPHLP
jgi:hypothetical protein